MLQATGPFPAEWRHFRRRVERLRCPSFFCATSFSMIQARAPWRLRYLSQRGRLFGRSWERFGASKVKAISMGNCTLTNVPVAIADLSSFNSDRRGPATGSHIADSKALAHINGVL